jgi:hypothetical protein
VYASCSIDGNENNAPMIAINARYKVDNNHDKIKIILDYGYFIVIIITHTWPCK